MTPTDPFQTAMAVLDAAQAGRFAEIREMFAPQLRPMVSAESLQASWTAQLDAFGPVVDVGAPISESIGHTAVVVKTLVSFEHGQVAVLVGISDGWLTGIQLAPADAAEPSQPWQPPEYADPATFDEQDVTIGAGPLAVPGTLSLPRQPGPLPAVVLLAGSGPLDRDETIGRNKPFKDLAWGLASRGVAVLRFDKVTYAHGDLLDVATFTMADEYVPDALAAVQLLERHPAVDATRVFVAGHSLGGTVAPRVAAAEPTIAGLVILAGGAQPLHWAAVRQVRYLASSDPVSAAAAQPAIEAMTAQARKVDSDDLSPSTPTSELPFGVPATYWLDLRGYDPVATAAGQSLPILICQGARDYQATVADDLTLWRAGLVDRPGVTIRVYDADNHMFIPGTGPSTPAEYESAQHMDPAVVVDIAAWLTTTGPAT